MRHQFAPNPYAQAQAEHAGIPKPKGIQQQQTWTAAEADERTVLDVSPAADGFWRCSVEGDVTLVVHWGTAGGDRVLAVDSPFAADLPGYVTIKAKPRVADVAASCRVTLQLSSGVGPAVARFLQTALAALPENAARFVALAASTVTIRGNAVVLALGQSIPLVSGSVLTAGFGFAEFDP